MTLLGENMSGQTPSRPELQEWAQGYQLRHPVLADSGFGVTFSYVDGGQVGLPSFSLLRQGVQVVINDDWVDEGDVIANLP